MTQTVYDICVTYFLSFGHPASISTIMKQTGLKSTSSVHYHVNKLVRAGLVRRVGRGFAAPVVILDYLKLFTPKKESVR